MGAGVAAVWGLVGGLVAALMTLTAAIRENNYRWPWRGNTDGVWPYLVVWGASPVVGVIVAAATHSQMTGPWPALIMGASAPSVIRGILSRIEVNERKPEAEVGGNGPT